MDEQKPEVKKRELTAEQIMQRNLSKMPNRQMSNRLKHLAREKNDMYVIRWATVLSIIFDNTRETGGKMEPYLR